MDFLTPLASFKDVGGIAAVLICFVVLQKLNATDRKALVKSFEDRVKDLKENYLREMETLKEVIANLRLQIVDAKESGNETNKELKLEIMEAKENGKRERDKLEDRIKFITSDKITRFDTQFLNMGTKLDLVLTKI